MTHAQAVATWLKADGIGVEIGAFKSPVPGIRPFYVDRYTAYAGEPTRADYLGDASELPFHSDSLDYVVTSHVLEHLANPVRALQEWHRVLRPGGIMYMVVPDRQHTFDRHRAVTDPEHMWNDFVRGVDQSDGTHIDEYLDNLDWESFAPHLSPEQARDERETLRRKYWIATHGGEIDMHFHVFDAVHLRAFVELVAQRLGFAWRILATVEDFPAEVRNGILLVVRVEKPWLADLRSRWHHARCRRNRLRAVRRHARPFPGAERQAESP